MPLCAPCFLRKTSTRAEKDLHCSHNNYIPHLLRMTVGVGFVVTSEQPSPLGWLARNGAAVSVCHPEQARNRTAVAPNTTTSPRASKFCFLKLPIVFGYAVPFTAISKKQNCKGSPQSLIYPYNGKLASFVIKQFFRYKKVHQTLSRSHLSAVLLHPSSHCDDYFRKTSNRPAGSLRMTKSADGHIPGIIAYRRRQKQQAVFVGFCSIPRGQPAGVHNDENQSQAKYWETS